MKYEEATLYQQIWSAVVLQLKQLYPLKGGEGGGGTGNVTTVFFVIRIRISKSSILTII